MDYALINEALKDIEILRRNRHGIFKRITKSTIDNLMGKESQGDYNEIIEIYYLGKDDLHIKLTLRTDSYGDGEYLHSVQIVKPVTKQVTDFEPIN